MIDKIDRFTLKKICIAYGFNDPHLLWSYVPLSTIKKVNGFLENLNIQYPENQRLREAEIIKQFEGDLEANWRKTKFLKILLMEAFEKKYISGSIYNELRKKILGIDDYDEPTKKAIQERWQNSYTTPDLYSVLQGRESEPQLESQTSSNQRR